MSSDQTTQYAKDVVSGKIVAGEFVRAQCKRHLDDIETGAERGLKWDAEAAEHAINFFPAVLTITEGAKEGQPFTLLPWHVFVVGSIFGWKDSNGFIRFRFVWLETGKGQAKSPLMAAIAIYLTGFYRKRRAEVYMIGETKDSARTMFRDAVSMLRAPIPDRGGETLEDLSFTIRGTGDLAYKVEHPTSESYFLPIANNDAVSGPKPIMVAGDEIHEMKSRKAIDLWRAAIVKKHGDSFMILGTNTPSVDQQICTEMSEACQKVVTGLNTDDRLFAYIARTDKDDDPLNDESCWIKALPALDITFPSEEVRAEVNTAKHQISTQLSTKRLYFGIPVGSAGFWTSEKSWDECQGPVDEEKMKGRKLHLSLDLSQKNDLTAISGCWEPESDEPAAIKTWYFTREFDIEARTAADHIPYREIEAEGHLTITPGRVIDYSYVVKQIADLCQAHDVVQLAVDSAKLEALMEEMVRQGFDHWLYEGPDEPEGVGLKIIKHKQGLHVSFDGDHLCMPTSITGLEDAMLDGTVIIEKSRLTTICASNTEIRMDAMSNKMFDKNRSRGRIDGMVTIAMAHGAMTGFKSEKPKEYQMIFV